MPIAFAFYEAFLVNRAAGTFNVLVLTNEFNLMPKMVSQPSKN